MMTNGEELALWLRHNYREAEPMTHLKLQKLLFYAYGAARAYGVHDELGEKITFEPWEHGPVCRAVWREYRGFGREPIPKADGSLPPIYGRRVLVQVLTAVLDVYGRMSAWMLREQTHREQPWRDAFAQQLAAIPDDQIDRHFRWRLAENRVQLPECMVDAGSFWLDGIPLQRYQSIFKLAEMLRCAPS